jgi:nucleoid-associated protein YgaU
MRACELSCSESRKETLMGLFGKSFEEKVEDALGEIEGRGYGARGLKAAIDGKVVTLRGEVPSLEVKTRVMEDFNSLVETDNTLNLITIIEEEPTIPLEVPDVEEEAAAAAAEERIHEVVSGDTLGAIAQRYYGQASMYMKIFEANRDILDNPDLIKVGQKLRIPE